MRLLHWGLLAAAAGVLLAAASHRQADAQAATKTDMAAAGCAKRMPVFGFQGAGAGVGLTAEPAVTFGRTKRTHALTGVPKLGKCLPYAVGNNSCSPRGLRAAFETGQMFAVSIGNA